MNIHNWCSPFIKNFTPSKIKMNIYSNKYLCLCVLKIKRGLFTLCNITLNTFNVLCVNTLRSRPKRRALAENKNQNSKSSDFYFTACVYTQYILLTSDESHKSHESCSFDCILHLSLVLSRKTTSLSRNNSSVWINKTLQMF